MPEWLNDAGPPGTILESLMRLGLAAMAGAFIGIERERPHRHVGLRTNMLVALAARFPWPWATTRQAYRLTLSG